MDKKIKFSSNTGKWIAVGVAIGAGMFSATGEPSWIAIGLALGLVLIVATNKKQ